MTLPILVLAFAASLSATPDSAKPPAGHPLDPLTAAEMLLVREILKSEGKLTPHLRFGTLALREPPKAAVRQQEASGRPRRTAEALLYDWGSSTPILAHVDLSRRRVIRWDSLASREPPMRNMIRRRLEEIVRADPRWTRALERRGITDTDHISILPTLGESRALPWVGNDRVVRAVSLRQDAIGSEAWLSGVRIEVNLSRASILSFTDTATAPARDPPRPPGRASKGTAPSTPPGLTIRGSLVRWRQWQLHFGVHPRRGLELWNVGWLQDGGERSILYRVSVSEVLSIYGDSAFIRWYPRDAGDEGLGSAQRNSAVELGDAPFGAAFVDAVIPDDLGRPVTVPRAVAIYERDGGVLWRHAGRARRARQLVLTSHATIDNYDFVFNWIFGEDGAIQVEVGLTGLVLLRRPTEEEGSRVAHDGVRHLVAPGLVAPHHQHFFSYRLDFDVDGASPNRVLELDTEALPENRGNPRGLWFGVREHPLASEQEAVRSVNAASSRRWRITNSAKRNGLGGTIGYVLDPGHTAFPAPAAGSPARRQAGFVNAQLFVTPYRRDEMHAAGEFQNFGLDGQGLPAWIAGNRDILDTDIVVWHTLGLTHLPRPEEFPVMPVYWASFRLVPSGFFSSNPVKDTPER